MMAGILEEPEESVQELQPLREADASCIEQLSEQDRFIIGSGDIQPGDGKWELVIGRWELGI